MVKLENDNGNGKMITDNKNNKIDYNRALIGAILTEPEAIIPKLPFDFTEEFIKGTLEKRIYNQVLQHFYENGQKEIDLAVLGSEINAPVSNLVSLRGYLKDITPSVWVSADEIIAGVIQENQKSYLDTKLKKWIEEVKTSGDLSGLKTKIMDELEQASNILDPEPKLTLIKDLMERLAEDIEKDTLSKQMETGVHTFDYRFPMFQGEFHLIGARTGVGKSHMAIFFAMNAAMSGRKVLFFSIEMTPYQMQQRIAAFLTDIDSQQFENRTTAHKHLDVLKELVVDYPIAFDFGQRSVEEIEKVVRVEKPELVVVDYLQQVKRPPLPREEAIAKISLQLKIIAKRYNCVVLCPCQLNRKAQDESKPTTANLRESGALEQDADGVMLLSRASRTEITVDVAKMRMRDTGEFQLTCDLRTSKFWEK